MINVLLPIAGNAKRFRGTGYLHPKPLITVDDVTIIERALGPIIDMLNNREFRLIFVVLEEHCKEWKIDVRLRGMFYEHNVEIVVAPTVTAGALVTCLLAKSLVDNSDPLLVFTPDVVFESADFLDLVSDFDSVIVTFKANSPDHSYAVVGEDDIVTSVVEKSVVSDQALVGAYYFRSGSDFVRYASDVVDRSELVRGEYYISQVFDYMIDDGLSVRAFPSDKMYVLGTADDAKFYHWYFPYHSISQIVVCADHSGFEMKSKFVKTMKDMGIQYIDFGTMLQDVAVDHYEFLRPTLDFVSVSDGVVGFAFCATGQGFNIAANKYTGIRSALVRDKFSVEMARRHNAANFFCVPSLEDVDLVSVLSAVLCHTFDGGRHATRIRKFWDDSHFIT